MNRRRAQKLSLDNLAIGLKIALLFQKKDAKENTK